MRILRFIFAFPVAVCALALTYTVAQSSIIKMLGFLPFVLNDALLGFLCGLAYMWAGTSVAPSHKKLTGSILAGLAVAGGVYSILNGANVIGNACGIVACIAVNRMVDDTHGLNFH